jgi:hypothetical protein
MPRSYVLELYFFVSLLLFSSLFCGDPKQGKSLACVEDCHTLGMAFAESVSVL